MTSTHKLNESHLTDAFKRLLKEQCYGSQGQLAQALLEKGFTSISQAKISRLLSKLGAVKIRNTNNEMIYILPEELNIPKSKQSIESVVLSVKHNGMQIILKTGIGGAPLISRMLDSMGESAGILGTLAGDDTIFIAPVSVDDIDNITQSIRDLLGVIAEPI